MHKLSEHLIEDFVSAILDQSSTEKVESYGTLKERAGTKYVILDGSDIETPVVEAMDAEDGDRVKVQMVNHNAVVVGNFSNPASARYAVAFVKGIPEGIMIGKLNPEHKPTGKCVLIKSDGMYLADRDGETELGKFVRDDSSKSTLINLANGSVVITGKDTGHGEIDIGKSLGTVYVAPTRDKSGNITTYALSLVHI